MSPTNYSPIPILLFLKSHEYTFCLFMIQLDASDLSEKTGIRAATATAKLCHKWSSYDRQQKCSNANMVVLASVRHWFYRKSRRQFQFLQTITMK